MKNKEKNKTYGEIIYYILKFSSFFRKVKKVDKNGPVTELQENAIYAFWHNKLIAATEAFVNVDKKAALASSSKDGELISTPLENYGYKVVRGSSGNKSVRALLSLVKLIKNGYSVGTPIDGPKGPMFKAKPGLLYLSQRSGRPIIPMGAAYSKKWIFNKTWDQLQFPKLFSTTVCYFGDPFYIGPEENLEKVALELEKKLRILDEKAEKILKNKKTRKFS